MKTPAPKTSPPSSAPAQTGRSVAAGRPAPLAPDAAAARPAHLRRYVVAGVILGMILSLAGVGIGVLMFRARSSSEQPSNSAARQATPNRANPGDELARLRAWSAQQQLAAKSGQGQPAPSSAGAQNALPAARSSGLLGEGQLRPIHAPDRTDSRQETQSQPALLRDIVERKRLLELPPLPTEFGAEIEPQQLARIFVDAPADCQLSFSATGNEPDPERGLSALELKVSDDKGRNERTWHISRKVHDGFAEQEFRLGQFILKDQWLSFAWNAALDVNSRPGKLLRPQLCVQAGQEQVNCVLSCAPTNAVRLELGKQQQIRLPWLAGAVTDPRKVSVNLKITTPGLPPFFRQRMRDDGSGKKHLLKIRRQAPYGNGTIDIEIVLQMSQIQGTCEGTLLLDLFVYQQKTVSQSDPSSVEKRVSFSRNALDDYRKKYHATAAKHRKELDKLLGQVKQCQDEILILNRNLQVAGIELSRPAVTDRRQFVNGQIEAMQMRIEVIKKEITRLETLQASHEGAAAVAEGNKKWCDDLAQFFLQLQGDSLVEFDVLVQIGNESRRILTATAETNERTAE